MNALSCQGHLQGIEWCYIIEKKIIATTLYSLRGGMMVSHVVGGSQMGQSGMSSVKIEQERLASLYYA